MSKPTADINELIEVLNDGVKFYEDAAANSPHRLLFQRMASTKRAIAADLKAEVARHGETPADGGTVSGAMRRTYTDLRAKLSSDPEAQYISNLEETEDRILRTFQDSLTSSDNVAVQQIVQRYLPDVLRMHNDMRDLKLQVKSRAA